MSTARAVGPRGAQLRRQTLLRRTLLGVVGAVFALPLLAMLEFTTRSDPASASGGRSLATWRTLADLPGLQRDYPDLWTGLVTSLELAALTAVLVLVLLVPTMVWVRLRLPRLARLVELLCLLPLTVPAIVLVVGLAPVYAWVVYLLGDGSWTLCFAYVVLVLPYAYRAVDTGLRALDLRTLAEAARSLGAGWGTVLWRVVVPNLRAALMSAAVVTVALVLGEFTVASLLNRLNLQVAVNLLGKRDASVSVAVSLALLALTFLLLVALSSAGRTRRRPADPPTRTPLETA